MATYEIPLSPEPQKFQINLAGITYSVLLIWNDIAAVWVLDIATALEVPILRGIPLVANVDLLEPYPYLNFGGQLIAQTDNAVSTPPTFNDLGTIGHLYFVTS